MWLKWLKQTNFRKVISETVELIIFMYVCIIKYIYVYICICIYIMSIPSPTLNIHTPGIPTLLVWVILIMLGVSDPEIVTWLTPSPTLIPAKASVPPVPLVPLESSPVVHCILPLGYINITKEFRMVVASIHWNVLVCRIYVHTY